VSDGYIVLDDLTFTSQAAVPVPTFSTWALVLLAGLLGLVVFMRRRA
jgi:hypothetical protein